MKRKMLLFLCAIISVICCAIGFAACGDESGNSGTGSNTEQGGNQGGNTQKPDDGNGEEKIVSVESVSLNKQTLTLETGDTYTLSETVLPANATDKSVSWSSSDTDILTVANGKLTAVSEGEATVTVKTTDGNKTATCTVTVNKPVISVESVSLNESSLILGFGEEATLIATVLPTDATNQKIIWSSSNDGIVEIKDGNITAIDSGITTITATAEDGNKTAKCEVTVKGLKYAEKVVNEQAVGYSVIGIGTVTDKEVIVPEMHNGKPVTSIGTDAFKDCNFMTSIVIPDSVEIVGSGAFVGCSNLESVTLPSAVISSIPKTGLKTVIVSSGKDILAYAFKNCTSLTSVTISDSVIFVGNEAFSGCSNLTELSIGNGIKAIGKDIFANCDKLQFNEFNNAYYLGNSTNNYVILMKVKNTSLTSCTVNEKTRAIYDSAFSECAELTNISIPDSVTSVGAEAFKGCKNLKYTESGTLYYLGNSSNPYVVVVKMKDRLTTPLYGKYTVNTATKVIYDSAFSSCIVSEVIIPDGVVSIGNSAFRWGQISGIRLPDSVIYIGDNAFSSCSSLTNATIGENVLSIGEYAFSSCDKLTDLVVSDNIEYVGDAAFLCGSLQYNEYKNGYYLSSKNNPYCIFISASKNDITNLTINEKTRIIYHSGICNDLVSVTIPESVMYISNMFMNSFMYFSFGLTNITVNENNMNYSSQDGILYNKTKTEFLSIPKAISGNLILPNGITSIDNSAFSSCSSLKSVSIPDSVTSIGYSAFWSCSSLKSVTIPPSVTSISGAAFGNCSSLNDIIFNGTKVQWESIEKDVEWDNGSTGNYTIHCTDGNIEK